MEIDLTNEELIELRNFLFSHKEEMSETGLTPVFWKIYASTEEN